MVGVIGRLKICYEISNIQYEEVIAIQTTSEFPLKYCPQVKFRVEEVTYIEDTVYGVVLSLIEPQFREDEYMVGSGSTSFRIKEYGVVGELSLCFLEGNL